MVNEADSSPRTGRAIARRMTAGVSGLVVAGAVAFGIPLAWVWIASKLAGTERDLTPSLAILITTGILVSYWAALLTGSWIRGRIVDPGQERTRLRRMSWNRSFRDEAPEHRLDPIERVFVVIAVVAIVLFEIWFFFFAGDPLPSRPALG